MKAQILKMEERQGVGKTSGKPYNGYFVNFLYVDGYGDLVIEKSFFDKSLCASVLPVDTMIDVTTAFRSSRVERVEILPNEPPIILRA